MSPLLVAKVGGSLFDLPDLRERLLTWITGVRSHRIVLVPGGGRLADVIRQLDRTHRLGEVTAHWLALSVLSVNAQFLSAMLGVRIVAAPDAFNEKLAVLDAFEFCRQDEGRAGALEHSWRVTSDSVAARVAEVCCADLALLKSVDHPETGSWFDFGRVGLVDEAFADLIVASGLRPQWVNLRRSEFQSRI